MKSQRLIIFESLYNSVTEVAYANYLSEINEETNGWEYATYVQYMELFTDYLKNIIKNNNVERLKFILDEHPTMMLSTDKFKTDNWQDSDDIKFYFYDKNNLETINNNWYILKSEIDK